MNQNIKYIAAAFLISGWLSAQKIDINKMPVAGPTPTIKITQPKTFTLKNGLTVMVVENNKLPSVNMSLSMDRPPYYEGKIAGVSDIMADQLGNGTTKMSKEAFNKRIDFLGANLNFNSAGASANTLSKYFPEIIGLMGDAVVHPLFTAEEVQNSKDREIENLKSGEKSADAIAGRVSNALIYGKNTSRGEFETEATLNAIQLADVKDIYAKHYAPNSANLVIVGDVKFEDVKKLVEKSFNDWKPANTVYAPLEPAGNLGATEVDIVDVPNAVQSIVKLSNIPDLKMNDPKYFPAILGNFILGGGGDARLFMNLREKNAFTYGAYSSLSASKYSPQFTASASVRNEVTDKAVVEFVKELKGISQVKPEELANAKAKLKGDFIRSLERPETIARFALNQKVQNLPSDFYTNYLKSIDNVTAADVANAMKTTILPSKSRIFVTGKASEISDGLEKLGYPVKYFDKDANPAAKPTVQKVAEGVTATSILENYLTAIGGRANIAKINSITSQSSASVQGATIDLTFTKAKASKSAMDLKMMGNTMQKVVFDGKDGYIESQGQKIPMPEEQKKAKMKSAEIFQELSMITTKTGTLNGIEKINGEDSYVIADGDTTYYYSVKTGLKTGETTSQKGPNGVEVKSPTVYSDYKDVSGVKMPYTINKNLGGMFVDFKVSAYQVNQAKDADFK